MIVDPKPRRRIVDPRAGELKVRAEGCCRACGGRSLPLNKAHLVAKGQRGDDLAANIIPLGGSGTIGCHGIQTSHHRSENCVGKVWTWLDVAYAVRAALTGEELDYILDKKGRDWLDRNWPEEP